MQIKFYISIIAACLSQLPTTSQEFEIKLNTQQIRINQKLTAEFDFGFLDNTLGKQTGASFTKLKTGTLSIDFVPKDTGQTLLGPFEFMADDILYRTNQAVIKVMPMLEPKAGIYVHSYFAHGRNYVIIEQVYEKMNKQGSGYTMHFGQSKTKETDMKDTLRVSLLYVINSKTEVGFIHSYYKPFDLTLKGTFHPSLVYSAKYYEIINRTGRPFILTRQFFRNLPDDFDLPAIEIK